MSCAAESEVDIHLKFLVPSEHDPLLTPPPLLSLHGEGHEYTMTHPPCPRSRYTFPLVHPPPPYCALPFASQFLFPNSTAGHHTHGVTLKRSVRRGLCDRTGAQRRVASGPYTSHIAPAFHSFHSPCSIKRWAADPTYPKGPRPAMATPRPCHGPLLYPDHGGMSSNPRPSRPRSRRGGAGRDSNLTCKEEAQCAWHIRCDVSKTHGICLQCSLSLGCPGAAAAAAAVRVVRDVLPDRVIATAAKA